MGITEGKLQTLSDSIVAKKLKTKLQFRRRDSEPRWAKIVNRLYTGEQLLPKQYDKHKEEYPTDEIDGELLEEAYLEGFYHGLAESLNEDVESVKESISFLHSVGMIEKSGDNLENMPVLTEKGFEIAHQRQHQKRQRQSNSAIAIFTLGLVFVGIFDILRNLPTVRDQIMLFVLLLGGSGGIIIGLVLGTEQLWR